ncbi:MAG: hypothetical protein PHO08_19145 [Methylococcales bacterium]|nr:hypothetical protein [Methylococcales bacterium]
MFRKIVTLSISIILGTASTDIYAHLLASSTMFGGWSQDGALVYVRNVSSKPITLSSKRIFNEQGGTLHIDYDTCVSSIPPNTTCVFFNETEIVNGRAYGASIILKDAPTSAVRAQFEIRNSHGIPSGAIPLARDNLR